ncbi:MAG: M23 family metallopeptidase [Erysipelotrichaceae bacterium]|nr:M23 family metallopeptidase [Erysipelotrichaceae bacterium]
MSLKCSVLKSGYCEQTQGFGGSNNHRGLDLVGKGYTLDDIVSYDDGNVLMSVTGYGNGQGEGVNWRYGNFVKIQHDNGTVCLYAHMEYTSVRVGQRVSKGQVIGRMGNSGNSSGGHLHWEFWSKNDYNSNIDPSPYLAPKEPIVLPKPVERDKNKRQFQVDYNDNLRVRKTPNGEILGILNQGIYDFISTETNGGYEWVKLKDGMYSAITDMSRILEVEKEEVQEDLIDEIEMLNKRIVELEDKLSLFEKQEQEYKYFVAPKEDIYYIKLKKNETLKYLRRD